jgi:hypothetical protein
MLLKDEVYFTGVSGKGSLPKEIFIAFISSERSGFNWGLSFFHDNAFEPISPKITPAMMAPIVIPGKVDLDLTHKIRKAGEYCFPATF